MIFLFRSTSILLLALLPILVMQPGLAAESEDTSSEIAEHMHEHFDRVNAIKVAVISGRLEDVRKPADWLVTHEELALLPSTEEMRRYASQVASAENLATAAAAVGKIARTCGDCHQAGGVELVFGFAEPPPQEMQSLMTQMQRHLWAADRMWAGLIAPSDAAWQQGADILAEVQLAVSDITDDPQRQVQISNLMQRLRTVGEYASQATSVELRSGLYGEFLSLCATCHSLTRAFPGAL